MNNVNITVRILEREGRNIRHIWVENIEWECSCWFQIGGDGGVLVASNNVRGSIAYMGGLRLKEAEDRNWVVTSLKTVSSKDSYDEFFHYFKEQFDLSKVKEEYEGDIRRGLHQAGMDLADFTYSAWGTW